MGQKVNPHGFRVGIIKDWDTRWFSSKKDFADNLYEDYRLRELLKKRLYAAGISKIEIERAAQRITVNIHTAKPGMVIGKGGTGVESLRKELVKFTGKTVVVNIMEVKNPDMDAQLVAVNIAAQP